MAQQIRQDYGLHNLHRWNPEFTQRRNITVQSENVPYVGDDQTEVAVKENVVRLFLDAEDNPDHWSSKTQQVVGFYERPILTKGLHVPVDDSDEKVALLDDRDGAGRPRSHQHGLTWVELLKKLMKPRFRSNTPADQSSQMNANGSSSPEDNKLQDHEPDAVKRLVFITNFDHRTLHALASTVPYSQKCALIDAFYNHITLKSAVKVTIPDDYISSFVLEFHLPFLALRNSKRAYRDNRLKQDGTPLRETIDISFLNGHLHTIGRNDEVDYLYEAEISCTLCGWDHWVWAAYMFVDTYHDSPDNRKDVQYYEDCWNGKEGNPCPVDPLTAGETILDNAIQQPREYWLKVLKVRVLQVLQEWYKVVTKVKESIGHYRKNFPFPPGDQFHNALISQRGSSASKSQLQREHSAQALFFKSWASKTIHLLRRMHKLLEENLSSWEDFLSGDVHYFWCEDTNTNISEPALQSFIATKAAFNEMRSLRQELRYLIDTLNEDITRDLNLFFAHENNQIAIIQQKTSRDVKMLSWMTFLSLPFTLAASFLSTEPGFIPIPTTPLSSVIVVLVLEGIMWLALDLLQDNWSRETLRWIAKHMLVRFRHEGQSNDSEQASC